MRVKSGLLAFSLLGAIGCGEPMVEDEPHDDAVGADGKADSSVEATVLNFEFDGQLVTDSAFGDGKSQINDQLLYTIGHLNGSRSVGRLDRLELTKIVKTAVDSKTRITYHAKLPVAWGSKTNLPTKYDFTLPTNVSYSGLEAFTTKYMHDCVDFGAHEVTSGSMWYYYRPSQSSCKLDAADVFKTTAVATVSPTNTTGKYPEYNKVWEDKAFNVVAIFGKYEDGATSGDAGIDGFNNFVAAIKTELARYQVTSEPATVPANPGPTLSDVTFKGKLPDGKTIQVNALLVDNISTASAAFYARYEALSTRADLIVYNGHAGLGQNVRALARKGKFVAGQYAIVFMNGCDTFAYVDGSLAETRARLNPDDPTGTKYMEIVTNAMPSFFSSMPYASMALVRGLLKFDQPMTYEQIFKNIDSQEVVLVTGEEDNAFTPAPPTNGGTFSGLKETASVNKGEELRYVASEVPAGNYIVKISHVTDHPGGDADLYVKANAQPTKRSYDCRPYKSGSSETCKVTLAAKASINISVFGYAAGESWFSLTADPDVSR